MKIKHRVMHALAVVAVLTAGCRDAPEQSARHGASTLSGVVRISGSSTMAPLIEALAKNFQALHPGVKIEVQAGGSGRGISDAREGKADIGMVSRLIPADERELVPFLIARDGIAVSLHADNPVKTLSGKQIAGIYAKKITNWSEVGGQDSPTYVIAASTSAGSTELFLNHFGLKHADVQADVLAEVNQERFTALEKNRGAIMYTSLGESERRAQAGEKIKVLSMAGIPATSENLAAGRYPLARPLALVTKGLPSGAVKAFVDYARSAAATASIERFEFVAYRD